MRGRCFPAGQQSHHHLLLLLLLLLLPLLLLHQQQRHLWLPWASLPVRQLVSWSPALVRSRCPPALWRLLLTNRAQYEWYTHAWCPLVLYRAAQLHIRSIWM